MANGYETRKQQEVLLPELRTYRSLLNSMSNFSRALRKSVCSAG